MHVLLCVEGHHWLVSHAAMACRKIDSLDELGTEAWYQRSESVRNARACGI